MSATVTPRSIRKTRLRLRLTQGEFAERLHTTRFTVLRWEAGKMKPQPVFVALIRALARAAR